MLEFIVLGEIPGTSVHITFAQVLATAALLLIASELRLVAQRKGYFKSSRSSVDHASL